MLGNSNRLRTHAPYVRTGQVELFHLFNHVDYLFPRITSISRIWLHTEITELRIALLSLHPDGMFTLIDFDLTQRRKEAQSLLLSSFNVHLSTFTSELQNLRTRHPLSTLNVPRSSELQNLRTSEQETLSQRSTLNVPRSSEPQNFRTKHPLSTLNSQRSSFLRTSELQNKTPSLISQLSSLNVNRSTLNVQR